MLPVLLFGRNFTENPIVLSGQPRHYLHCDGAVLVLGQHGTDRGQTSTSLPP
jgi:hypothetical protein